MKTATFLTAVLFATVFAGVANAQQPIVHPGHWYHHASTYEEGIQRGRADVIRSWGEYNYNTSLARINNEQARSAALDNRYKGVETYFAVKEVNREARAAARAPRATQQELVRYAKSRAPKRLDGRQFEESIGKVVWPTALDGEQFAAQRAEIDRLMSDRTLGEAGLGTQNHQQVKALTVAMQTTLKSQIREMSPSDYVLAKKFLTSLEYEAQFVPGTSGIAAK